MSAMLHPRANSLRPGLLFAVFISVVALPVVVLGDNGLATRMREISENLDRRLNDMMATQTVEYSTVNTTLLPYKATTKFNPKGMGELYNITNKFIDLIQSKQAYPEGMIEIENSIFKVADPTKEWKLILTHYSGVAGLAVVGLLLAALLPCVGLFFCCCRCAGKCGARSEPFDKKHDHCRKVFLNILLICVATILLFGVVCAFVTNDHMQEGTRELPNNTKVSLRDVGLYLTTTKREIETLLKVNFDELETTLSNVLETSGEIVAEELAKYSNAVSLTNLNIIVSGLGTIKEDLTKMTTITQELRSNATRLDIRLRGVRINLLNTTLSCEKSPSCRQILNQYKLDEMSKMTVQVHFDRLPNVTLALNNITALMNDNIESEVRQGIESFRKIQKDIQREVNRTIPDVKISIRKAGDSLANVSKNMTNLLDRINNDIERVYIPQIDEAQRHIDEYSPYRNYVGLGVSAVLLTVVSCLTYGLLCGIFGKRPDGYGDDCCNKGSGARFLMMAVWIMFLLTSILMIVTLVHMITGVVVQRGICEPLKNPQDNKMFSLVDQFVHIKNVLYPLNRDARINMSYIISACHRNETLYKVLLLENVFDLHSVRNYVDRYNINETIAQLRQKISLSPGVVIFRESARAKLMNLTKSGLSETPFHQFADNLKDNVTSFNLEHLANKLRDIVNKLPNHQAATKAELTKSANDLDRCHRELVVPMTTLSDELSEQALSLQEHIKFNHTSMSEAIEQLITEVTTAQKFLNNEGPSYVKKLAQDFGETFVSQVYGYLDHVVARALNNVGKCGPVSNAYNATLVAGCNKILDPFNGFWVSVGWCLILFIPTIILCVKLSALYQKSDPYPGPLVDAVHDKKHAHHPRLLHGSYPESYDGPANGPYSDRDRDAHQGTSHNDSRYADLAPKNWDMHNGGPPRYHQAPGAPPLSTEYERPPPYYYPGPEGRN